MSSLAAKLAIESRLANAWSTTAIQWANVNFRRPNMTPYVRCTVMLGESRESGFGQDKLVRTVGVVQVDVFVPENSGMVTAKTHAETLGTLFQFAQFGTTGLVTCAAASTTDVGPDGTGWYQVAVRVPFRHDETVS